MACRGEHQPRKSSHKGVKRKEEGRGESTLEGDLAKRRVKRRESTCVREVGGEGRSDPRAPVSVRGRDGCVGNLPHRQERAKQPWEGRRASKGPSDNRH